MAATLALFGLGVVALLLACACTIALVVVGPGLRPAPLGAAAGRATLPAAAVALGGAQIAPQFGERVIELRTPSMSIPPATAPAPGRCSSICAASPLPGHRDDDPRAGRPAEPRRRAPAWSLLRSRRRPDARPPLARGAPRSAPARAARLGAPARVPLPRERELDRAGVPPSLVAYGRPIMGRAVRWQQPTASPSAPTLHLVLSTGRSQAIVRDYPEAERPLEDPWWPTPAAPLGAPRFGIPTGTSAAASVPNDRLVPQLLVNLSRLDATPQGQRLGLTDAITFVMGGVWERVDPSRRRVLARYVRQELLLRRAAREPIAFRDRFLGRCLTPQVRRRAIVPVDMPDSTRAANQLAVRWAVVWRRWGGDPRLRRLAAADRTASIDPVQIATARR